MRERARDRGEESGGRRKVVVGYEGVDPIVNAVRGGEGDGGGRKEDRPVREEVERRWTMIQSPHLGYSNATLLKMESMERL
jgi:hypothetical protein